MPLISDIELFLDIFSFQHSQPALDPLSRTKHSKKYTLSILPLYSLTTNNLYLSRTSTLTPIPTIIIFNLAFYDLCRLQQSNRIFSATDKPVITSQSRLPILISSLPSIFPSMRPSNPNILQSPRPWISIYLTKLWNFLRATFQS